MGRAQGARCPPETAGGGRPTLADRPSLLPRGMERARVRRGIPHPPQPDTHSTLDSAPATFQARATGASFVSCSARSSGPMRARSSAALTGSRLATGPRARGIPLIPLNPGESRLKKRVRSRGPGRSGERRKTEGGRGALRALRARRRSVSRLRSSRRSSRWCCRGRGNPPAPAPHPRGSPSGSPWRGGRGRRPWRWRRCPARW